MQLVQLTTYVVETLTQLIEKGGLFAVFILMTAESALIPIPSEITMPFAGFLAGRGLVNFWSAIFVGAFGNLIGSLIAYWLGYIKGENWTRYAIKRWGKWLFIKESEFNTAKKWFGKYGQAVTFTSRLLPIVRTFISLPAGIAKMDIAKFSIFTFIGSFIWSTFLAWLGLKLGQNWMSIEPYFRKFQALIIGLTAAAIVLFLYKHFKKERG